MKRASIIIEGYYGCGSLGDEAILVGLLQMLKKQYSSVDITVVSFNPKQTAEMYDVQAVGKGFWGYLRSPLLVSKSDSYMFGGGNLLHDQSFYTLPLFLARVLLVKLLRKRFYVIAQGVGPVTTGFGRLVLKAGLALSDAVAVRDVLSSAFLDKIGVRHVVAADAAFGASFVDALAPDKPVSFGCLRVGVALRDSRFFWSLKPEDYECKVAQALDCLISRYNAEVVFVCLMKPQSGVDDYATAKSVIQKMRNRGNVKVVADLETPLELRNLFLSFDVLVGVPLHSLIFAAISQTPFVAVSYHPKVDGYLESICYSSDYIICGDCLTSEGLVAKVEAALSRRDLIKQQLNRISLDLKRKASLNIKVTRQL